MVPSPRKIKPFYQKLDLINQKYDVFIIRNEFTELNAYDSGRKFFLEHPEYTHLAILPDDLLVNVQHVDKLVDDLRKGDYPVLSGVCNYLYSSRNFFNRIAIIEHRKYEAIDMLKKSGKYNFFRHIATREEYEKLRDSLPPDNKVIQVAFSAFPFTIARRDVIEKFDFGHNPMGVDTVFYQNCIKHGIKTYADLSIEMLHLKGMEENKEMSNVIRYAFENNIRTKVVYNPLHPPKREEIFLPKKIEH